MHHSHSTHKGLRALGAALLIGSLSLGACGGAKQGNDTPPVGSTPPAEAARVEVVASGLRNPWGLAFLSDGSMLVTEKGGRLWRLSANGQQREAVSGVPTVHNQGQGGLLDVVAESGSSPWVYWSYAERGTGAQASLSGTAVARGRLHGAQLDEVQVLFRQQPKLDGDGHYGARLALGPDDTLFIALGDRMKDNPRSPTTDFAQNQTTHLGKVVRIRREGGAAPANPAWGTPGALPEIWSTGHRNIQSAALHPDTGELWVAEHGPQGGDEVNIARPGSNHGWPLRSYGCPYGSVPTEGCRLGAGTHAPDFSEPLTYWEPFSIAPSGMAFYTGDGFPEWRGSLFVGALAGKALWRLTLEDGRVVGRETLFKGEWGRIRDVRQGPDGWLYLLTDEEDGKLLRVRR